MIKILIVDDHSLFIDGLKSMFSSIEDISVTGEAYDGKSACTKAEELSPDVILLDIGLPDIDGTEVCKLIHEKNSDIKIIAITMHEEHTFVTKMLENGASGYLLKNSKKDQMITAIREVNNGGSYYSKEVTDILIHGLKNTSDSDSPKVSRREKEVLELIVYEYTTNQIAEKLFISLNTVESHRANLLAKLNVKNTAGLVRVALEKNLLSKEN